MENSDKEFVKYLTKKLAVLLVGGVTFAGVTVWCSWASVATSIPEWRLLVCALAGLLAEFAWIRGKKRGTIYRQCAAN